MNDQPVAARVNLLGYNGFCLTGDGLLRIDLSWARVISMDILF